MSTPREGQGELKAAIREITGKNQKHSKVFLPGTIKGVLMEWIMDFNVNVFRGILRSKYQNILNFYYNTGFPKKGGCFGPALTY